MTHAEALIYSAAWVRTFAERWTFFGRAAAAQDATLEAYRQVESFRSAIGLNEPDGAMLDEFRRGPRSQLYGD